MKRITTAVIVASILAMAGISFAQDASFKVVGNAGTTPDTISKRDLGRIFLGRKSTWPGGQEAEPVDQARNAALRTSFCETVLNKTVDAVESHWQAQVFSGKGTPPKALNTDAEVLDYVRKWPGAVGYVSRNASADGVKVIAVTD